jgi:hypothetical protein
VETSHVEQVISNSSDSNNDDIDHVREARGRPKLSEEEKKKKADDSVRYKKSRGRPRKSRELTQAKKDAMYSFVTNLIKKDKQ